MSKHYPLLTKPLVGAAAFSKISEETSPPQAAILLLLGRQLRGDDAAIQARARKKRKGNHVGLYALDDEQAFPIPQIAPTRRRFASAVVTGRVKKTYGYSARRAGTWERAYADCATQFYDTPDHDTAADLFQLCLDHPKELVRIASAAAYYSITTSRERALRVLVNGVRSSDDLERSLAATALARVNPTNRALRGLTAVKRPRRRRGTSNTITIVHGTWASNSAWYQPPSGDFFSFVGGLRPDLYSLGDFFRWSGGWSDGARSAGANELVQWVIAHGEQGLDVMGHSHGANVILLGTNRGLSCGKTILLSCPVHVGKYFPDFSQVLKPIWSVRVKHDLVILADGGAQRFNHPDIREIVLPIWFDHSATYDPQVWRKYKIAQQIGL